MSARYRHTQSSRLVALSALAGSAGVIAAGAATGMVVLMVPLALVLLGFGICFSSLTVEVTDDELRWHFGPGIWRKRVARSEIAGATPETNKWWWGWGIHCTPRGWLYNVSGLAAVEVALRDGTMFRIGSDEPGALAAALKG